MSQSWRIGIDQKHVTELVATGLFAFSRNPIYFGLFLAFGGFFFIIPSVATLAYLIILGVAVNSKIAHEEQHLLAMHPEEYGAYCGRVRRWI